MTYADSSFLVSLLIEDANSDAAKKYLIRNPAPIFYTSISKSEVFHAIRTLVFTKQIDLGQMTRALIQFEQDEDAGFLHFISMKDGTIFEKADQLSNRHSTQIGVRYIDTLHVASALLASARHFLTFDARQGQLASAVGLNVKPMKRSAEPSPR